MKPSLLLFGSVLIAVLTLQIEPALGIWSCKKIFGRMITPVFNSIRQDSPRKRMIQAWDRASADPVICRFQDALRTFYFEENSEPDQHRVLPEKAEYGESLGIIDRALTALNEEIQSRHFQQLAQLLLNHQLLPAPLDPIMGLENGRRLALLLNHHAADLSLNRGHVKSLVIAILDRLHREIDPFDPAINSDRFPEWLRHLKWGNRQISVHQIHDTLNLKEATAETFFFHLRRYQPVVIQQIAIGNWEEAIKASFADTLKGGSVMHGRQFVSIVGTLVRDLDFYNYRTYSNLTFYEDRYLKTFGKILRKVSLSVHLSPDDKHRLRLYLEHFALGLSAANRFTGRSQHLTGISCTSRQEFQWCLLAVTAAERDIFGRAMSEITAKKHPELPVHPYITDLLRSLFDKKWGT